MQLEYFRIELGGEARNNGALVAAHGDHNVVGLHPPAARGQAESIPVPGAARCRVLDGPAGPAQSSRVAYRSDNGRGGGVTHPRVIPIDSCCPQLTVESFESKGLSP